MWLTYLLSGVLSSSRQTLDDLGISSSITVRTWGVLLTPSSFGPRLDSGQISLRGSFPHPLTHSSWDGLLRKPHGFHLCLRGHF